MKIKSIEPSKIKVKIDKTSEHIKMDGRERHLALGRLLEKGTHSLDAESVVSAILKGYSILPRIDIDNKVMQNLFAIDLLNVDNIPMYINMIVLYEEIGIPPFALLNIENDNDASFFRLLFATDTLIRNEKDINKLKAILRAIAIENGIICRCPSIIEGGNIKKYSFYGDIRVDDKTALSEFQPSYNRYILKNSNYSSKIRYPKNWFKNNNY